MKNSEINIKEMKGLLVGAGALGLNLYSLCKKQGILFSAVVDKRKTKSSLIEKITFTSLKQLPQNLDFNFIAICVEDKNICVAATEIAEHFNDLSGKFCFHTSGALDTYVLKKLKNKGAHIGSIHPLMTFNTRNLLTSVKNVPFAIEGDPAIIPFLKEFSHNLKAKPLLISAELKGIYHLLGVFSSNLYFGLLNGINSIVDHLNQNDISISLQNLEPIIQQTLKTAIKPGISPETMSGPVKRKDFSTIKKHIDEIRINFPEQINIYKELSLVLAKIAGYDDEEINTMKKLFSKIRKAE